MTTHHPPQSPNGGSFVPHAAADSRIAVIGMGCRYPGADNPLALWENILTRRQGFRRMPDCRLRLADYHDADRKVPDKTYSTRAGLIDGFVFDWAKRRIPKSTVEVTDIAHWLALEVALQAVADAGYGPGGRELPKDRTAAILGNTLTGEQCRALSMRLRWPFVARAITAAAVAQGLDGGTLAGLLEETEAQYKSVFPTFDEDTLAGNLSNTIPGRVCNYLDLHGGGYVVDGACSSSLLATITAADALVRGDIDVALAGGVDISIDTFELVGFSKVGALAPTDMRVYDKRAAGFIPGEGCGVVILKRYADALRDGDAIYATLRGWGISSDGKGGITAPTARGQALALERAYRRAGYAPQTLDFIEGHGTGTPVGDAIELKGIQLVHDWFAAEAEQASSSAEPATTPSIGITSFKSLVGHTKAAAGVGGLIKAVMAVNRRILPPTVGCSQPSPVFDQDARVLYPLLRGEVRDPVATLRAGVSAMGFGGINSHITLESGPKPDDRLVPTLPESALLASYQDSEVFPLAAVTRAELTQAVTDLLALSRGMAVGEMPDLSAQCCTRAEALGHGVPHRAAVVAEDPLGLADALERLLAKLEEPEAAPQDEASAGAFPLWHSSDRRIWLSLPSAANAAPRPPRVGWVFPGQGAQFVGCAAHLLARLPWARAFLAQADTWLAEVGGTPVSTLLYPAPEHIRTEAAEKAWATRLAKPAHTEPVVIFSTVLWCKYLRDELGLAPSIVAGHSLGELAALYVAGALDDKEVIQLAAIRGQAIAAVNQGAMAGLGCDAATVEKLIEKTEGYAVIANRNSPKQTVISGETAVVERLLERARETRVAGRRLAVAGGFHCKFVEPAGARIAQDPRIATEVTLALPVVTSVLSDPPAESVVLSGRMAFREHVAKQMYRPVDFIRVAEELRARCDLVLEVGPGRVLSGLLADNFAVHAKDSPVPRVVPVETRSQRQVEFSQAVAALFVHGSPVRLAGLFSGRLVREFVPASAKQFVENHCEKLASMAAPAAAEAVERVAAQTSHPAWLPSGKPLGLTPEQFASYASERAEFLDSVTQVVAVDARSRGYGANAVEPTTNGAIAWVPPSSSPLLNGHSKSEVVRPQWLAAQLSAPPQAEPSLKQPLSISTPVPSGAVAQAEQVLQSTMPVQQASASPAPASAISAARSEGISALAVAPEPICAFEAAAVSDVFPAVAESQLLDVQPTHERGREAEVLAYLQDRVAQRTGFPTESLTPDLRLLDDLNLDSIKTAELSAEAAAHFRVEPAPDAMRVANASLEELAALLTAGLPATPLRGAEPAPAIPTSFVDATVTPAENQGALTGPADVRASNVETFAGGYQQRAETFATPPLAQNTQRMSAGVASSVAPRTLDMSTVPTLPPSGPDMLTLVYERVAQRTGFPPESLDPSLRLLDDLNLDSIKVAELVSELAQTFALDAAALDATRFANASLSELAEALSAQGRARVTDALNAAERSATKAAQPSSAQPQPAYVETKLEAHETFAQPATPSRQRPRLISGVEPISLPTETPRFSSERPTEVRTTVPAKATLRAPAGAHAREAAGAPWVRHFAQEWCVDPLEKPARTDWPAGQRVRVAALGSASAHDAARFSDVLGQLGGQSEVAQLDASLRGSLDPSVAALCVFYGANTGSLTLDETVAQLAALAQALPAARPDLALAFIEVGEVTAQAGFVCGLSAFAASLHHERPSLRVRVLSLPAACPLGECAGILGAEFGTATAFDHVRYDASGERWITGHRLLRPEESTSRRVKLNPGDVVLVTGGAKGITGACAEAWAARDGVTLALVGRSPQAQVATELDALRARGIRCEYFSVDLADPAAIDALVAQVHVRLGHIRAVVHGAGLNHVRRAELVNAESARAEIAPKLTGALALLEVLERRQAQQLPELIVGLTSVIGVTGMPGNAWYAFANESLDRSLALFAERHPEVEVSTLAYSVWSDVGMGHRLGSVEALARTGTAALSPAQGIESFLSLVDTRPSAQQVIVTSRLGTLDTWRSLEPTLPTTGPGSTEHLRFIDEVVYCEPGVEAIVRTTLSVEHDDFIRDHCFEGRYLLPAVFGLEAMAQAAAFTIGTERMGTVTVTGAKFLRPVEVDELRGTQIDIAATRVLSAFSEEIGEVFEVSLSAYNDTSASGVMFNATLAYSVESDVLCELAPPLPGQPLAVDLSAQGIYGSVLFQGPSFQRIKTVYDLSPTGGAYELAGPVPAPNISTRWILGDPYARDAQLQFGQLALSPHRALPVYIERLAVHQGMPLGGRRLVRTRLKRPVNSEAIIDSASFDSNRNIVDVMSGCVGRIIGTSPGMPSAEEVASGWTCAESDLVRCAQTQATRLGVTLPEISLRWHPGLHDGSRESRRSWEQGMLSPLVTRVREGASGDEALGEPLNIVWTKHGKPEVTDSPVGVSLAHDNLYCLAVAGLGQQGCDICPVVSRSRVTWDGILGVENLPARDALKASGWSYEAAGAAVWAARESVFKAFGLNASGITLCASEAPGAALLAAGGESDGGHLVLAFTHSLHGAEYVFAMHVNRSKRGALYSPLANVEGSPSCGSNGDIKIYERLLDAGPRGQEVFVHRFPLTCADVQGVLQCARPSAFAAWSGKVRELFGFQDQSYHHKFVSMLGSNDLVSVTNSYHSEFSALVAVGEWVEVQSYLDDVSPEGCRLCWDWYAMLPGTGGPSRPLGLTRMTVSAVEVLEYGVVRPTVWPEFFLEFNGQRGPKRPPRVTNSIPFTTGPGDGLGHVVFKRLPGPKRGPLLQTMSVSTGLNHSNLVGNVYFANYVTWQELVRDRFTFRVSAESFQDADMLGEFISLSADVEHLNETMPFSEVEVRMSLSALFERGCDFEFDYFRVGPDGDKKKLATGRQRACWAVRQCGVVEESILPERIIKAMMSLCSKPSKGGEKVVTRVVASEGDARAFQNVATRAS